MINARQGNMTDCKVTRSYTLHYNTLRPTWQYAVVFFGAYSLENEAVVQLV